MNINEIFEVLEKLGIDAVVCDGRVVQFKDHETGKRMSILENRMMEVPLNIFKAYRFFTIFNEKRMIRLRFDTAKRDGKLVPETLLLSKVHYDDGEREFITDFSSLPYARLNIDYFYKIEGEYLSRDKMSFDETGRAVFDVDNKVSFYDNQFGDTNGMSPEEIAEELDSQNFVSIFSEYYGKLYPRLSGVINNIKEEGHKYKK
jgi:hypothetical protein